MTKLCHNQFVWPQLRTFAKHVSRLRGKDVIYSQDLGYSILGLRILNPGNLVLGLRFKDPES